MRNRWLLVLALATLVLGGLRLACSETRGEVRMPRGAVLGVAVEVIPEFVRHPLRAVQ